MSDMPDFSDVPPPSGADYGETIVNHGHDSRVRTSQGTDLVSVGARLPMPKDAELPPEQWRVLTDAIWPSAKTPEAVKLALDYCRARKLDPFKRPVHIVPMWNSQLRCEVETVWPGISELQTTAARTGEWAGMDKPEWGEEIEHTFVGQVKQKKNNRDVYVDREVTLKIPEWCSVTVYRVVKGQRHPFTEPVYWMETYATLNKWVALPNSMWERRSRGQIIKCAKAASLRAAFPEELGSQYAAEEMEGKDTTGGIIIPGTATEVPGEQQEKERAEKAAGDRLDGLEAAMTASANIDATDAQDRAADGSNVEAAQPQQQQPAPDETETAKEQQRQQKGEKVSDEAVARAEKFAQDTRRVIFMAAQHSAPEAELSDVFRNAAVVSKIKRLKRDHGDLYKREIIGVLTHEKVSPHIGVLQNDFDALYADATAALAQQQEAPA